jgi:hypothetical protein
MFSQNRKSTPPYEVVGAIKLIYDVQTFQPSGFTKREFVVTTEDDYPQPLKFELIKEKCALLDHFNVNDRVKVLFRIRGNATKDGARYFVGLQAFQVDKVDVDGSSVDVSISDAPFEEPSADLDDDMPF